MHCWHRSKNQLVKLWSRTKEKSSVSKFDSAFFAHQDRAKQQEGRYDDITTAILDRSTEILYSSIPSSEQLQTVSIEVADSIACDSHSNREFEPFVEQRSPILRLKAWALSSCRREIIIYSPQLCLWNTILYPFQLELYTPIYGQTSGLIRPLSVCTVLPRTPAIRFRSDHWSLDDVICFKIGIQRDYLTDHHRT